MFVSRVARCIGAAAFALLVVWNAPPGAAATPAPSPSPSASPATLPEIGRVFTSDRRSEPIGQTSRPTYVVDREHIEAYGARTVGDALQEVPGVELESYGAFGSLVNYGIRGSTSEQTLVLVDGQPVSDPTSGSAYLDQLSTVGVNRIEVVESGSSTLYGTSATGGVINVITSVPRGAYLEASAGSFADRDVRVGVGDGHLGASFERHVATNAYAYPTLFYGPNPCVLCASGPTRFSGSVRDNAYADQSVARVSLDRTLGGGFRVRARGDVARLLSGIPGSLTFSTPQTSQALANDTGLIELERTTRMSTLTLDISGANQRLAYADPSFGEDDTYSGRSQLSLKDAVTLAHADLVAGIDFARESGNFTFPGATIPASATGPAITTPPSATGATESQAAAYVQIGGSPFVGTRLTAGLRGENDAPHGTVLAPSFGGVVHAGVFRLAGTVGESFRVPTLQDLYYPGGSNPALQPERALNGDATVAYETHDGTLSLGWFGRSGSNFIVLDPARNYIPFNAQRARTAGIQLTAQTKPVAGVVANLSFTDIYQALNLTTGGRLPQNPVGQVILGITHPFSNDRYSYGARWRVVGSNGNDAANVPPPLVNSYDAYDTLDGFFRYKLAPGAVLSVRGFNLGDSHDAPIFGYPAPGRRFDVELSTR